LAPPRLSWWARLRADLGRRIEHRGLVLWYLMFERGLKGVALILASIYIVTHTDSGLDPLVRRTIALFNLTAGSGFIRNVILDNLAKIAGISENTLWVLAGATFIYGLIEASEGVGLALRRRWAEYLVVLATAFFIPFEVMEVLRRPGPIRIATLLVNVAVVIYLIRKKQLFQLGHPTEA
jgi:uncharacterized membrane protein (DUF2068 family)